MTRQEEELLERYLLLMLAQVVAALADDAGKTVDAQDLRDMAIHVAAIHKPQS